MTGEQGCVPHGHINCTACYEAEQYARLKAAHDALAARVRELEEAAVAGLNFALERDVLAAYNRALREALEGVAVKVLPYGDERFCFCREKPRWPRIHTESCERARAALQPPTLPAEVFDRVPARPATYDAVVDLQPRRTAEAGETVTRSERWDGTAISNSANWMPSEAPKGGPR